jgi:hypothetical protein
MQLLLEGSGIHSVIQRLTCTPQAALHLVKHQQCARLITQLAQALVGDMDSSITRLRAWLTR